MGLTNEQHDRILELHSEMHNSLYIYAKAALGNNALAEEAVQETFRIACGSPNKLLTSSNPNGWLMEALKYVIRNIRRNRARLSNLMTAAIPLEAVASEPSRQDMEFNAMCEEYVGEEDYRLLRMSRWTSIPCWKRLRSLELPWKPVKSAYSVPERN